MIRFILRRTIKHEHSGLITNQYETVLCEVPILEEYLSKGGYSENGYDYTEFVGISMEPPFNKERKNGK